MTFNDYKETNEINEASLSRIWLKCDDNHCGTISAYQLENTKAENKKLHKLLGGLLTKNGFGKIQVQGVYSYQKSENEEAVGKEMSYFVWVPKDKDPQKYFKLLVALGKKFHQESISWADCGEDFKLYAADPDKAKVASGTPISKFKGKDFGKTDSPSYSKIRGRKFAWANYTPLNVVEENYRDLRFDNKAQFDAMFGEVSMFELNFEKHLKDGFKIIDETLKNRPTSGFAKFFRNYCGFDIE